MSIIHIRITLKRHYTYPKKAIKKKNLKVCKYVCHVCSDFMFSVIWGGGEGHMGRGVLLWDKLVHVDNFVKLKSYHIKKLIYMQRNS